jgi:hypothetical protein
MGLALLCVKPAEPAVTPIVCAMLSERMMDLVHQTQRRLGVTEAEEVADGEGVGPQVALGCALGGETGSFRETLHEFDGLCRPPDALAVGAHQGGP